MRFLSKEETCRHNTGRIGARSQSIDNPSINGVPVTTSRYVASWVVNVTSEFPDPDTAPNSPSDLVRAIFVEEDGTEVHYALTKIEAS